MILWGWALKERSLESAASLGWTAARACSPPITLLRRAEVTVGSPEGRPVPLKPSSSSPSNVLKCFTLGDDFRFLLFAEFPSETKEGFPLSADRQQQHQLKASWFPYQTQNLMKYKLTICRLTQCCNNKKEKKKNLLCFYLSLNFSRQENGYKHSYFLAYQSWLCYQENCIKIKSS